jgi:fatty acid desaturase
VLVEVVVVEPPEPVEPVEPTTPPDVVVDPLVVVVVGVVVVLVVVVGVVVVVVGVVVVLVVVVPVFFLTGWELAPLVTAAALATATRRPRLIRQLRAVRARREPWWRFWTWQVALRVEV